VQETHPAPFSFRSKTSTGDNLAVRPAFANLFILCLKSSCFSPHLSSMFPRTQQYKTSARHTI